jgi:Ca2+-binding RTX toxin-like protein
LEGGGGNDTLSGAAGNDRLNGDSGADLMRGGAGNDRYIVDSLSDVIDEQGNADTDDRVDSSVTVNLKTLGAGLIEHADLLGTPAINATGNDGNNSLSGNDGANVLDGKGGADKMVGGAGNDTYIVNNSGDQVKETISGTAGGIDLVKSAKSFALGANVENLTLLGSGNINATGNSLGNVLTGNDGANILNGGGGNDTMAGGKGNDTYVVNAAGDAVNETVLNSSGGGVDTVESSITFSLATHTNVENLTLTGSGNIKGFGNGLNNTIIGNSGDNYLDGGAGNDAMKGGAGNDTYVINAATDVIDEEGNIDFGDEVHSVFSINLSTLAGGAIERATLLGSAATNVTGNDAENILIGNNGANILDGGLLGDIMIGGKGDDTYVVESSVDHVEEEMDGGIDLVRSWVSFDLSGQPNIENITLLGSANASAIGNTRANVLIGNDGNNYLGGSLGNDKMVGNEGDDIYEVDSVGDIVSETVANNANGGVDLVESSVSFSLVAHVKIEHLNLTGTSAINGTGNALDNHIMGNTNKNTIDGGIGNDVLHGGYDTDNLTGGAGADIFDFDVLSELGDTITDFSKAAGDKLDIHDLLVSVGYLGTDAFTDQYVSFSQNGTTTNILFDADGAGLVSSAVVLASLLNANLTSLDSGSFIV